MRRLKSRRSIAEALAATIVGVVVAVVAVRSLQHPATWLVATILAVVSIAIALGLTATSAPHFRRNVVVRVCVFGVAAALCSALIVRNLGGVQEFWGAFASFGGSGDNPPQTAQGFDHMGTAFLACLLGQVSGCRSTSSCRMQLLSLAWLHRRGRTDALDAFLHDATEAKALVQLSLESGKFYVGNIQKLPSNPTASNAWVRILPMVSGFRDETSKTLKFTTFYQDVYEELSLAPEFNEDWLLDFVKIVPVASIVSANRFDPKVYVRFAREQATAAEAGASPNQ